MVTVLLFILGVVIVALGLAISIGLHEIGHLVPAKKFGVRVSKYMIGFGPTIWSRRRGETEYGIKAFPLGGFVAMQGMLPPQKGADHGRDASTGFVQTLVQDAPHSAGSTGAVIDAGVIEAPVEDDESRSFWNLATWKRVIIMLGGPIMNLLIGIVLYAVVLCGFGIAQFSTTIGSVNECVIPATSTQTECTDADLLAPGAEAGILPGDELISFDGTPITSWEQATALIRAAPGETLSIVVDRDGERVDIQATPLLTERYVYDEAGEIEVDENGQDVTADVGFLGIGPAAETVQQPITAVLPAVGDNIVRVVHIILNLPQRLVDVAQAAFGTEERDPNGPVSVVGVGRMAGEIASIDTAPVAERAGAIIGLLASLNVALFVFNLIPLLPLDGGHVAAAVIDAIRRGFAKVRGKPAPRPVDIARLLPLTLAVVVIFGGMSLLLIYADIVKPISIF